MSHKPEYINIVNSHLIHSRTLCKAREGWPYNTNSIFHLASKILVHSMELHNHGQSQNILRPAVEEHILFMS